MHLLNIVVARLITEAGGDQCAMNKSLQIGRPAQIFDLAKAFHDAGACTAEADAAFNQLLQRFEWAWNRENGEHPINDSAEVQRVTKSLGCRPRNCPRSRSIWRTSRPPWPRHNELPAGTSRRLSKTSKISSARSVMPSPTTTNARPTFFATILGGWDVNLGGQQRR